MTDFEPSSVRVELAIFWEVRVRGIDHQILHISPGQIATSGGESKKIKYFAKIKVASKKLKLKKRLVIVDHGRTDLVSSARAMMPAARGAEALVPVCLSVHLWWRSVVTCRERERESHSRGAVDIAARNGHQVHFQ